MGVDAVFILRRRTATT